jgi:hypothetical protein
VTEPELLAAIAGIVASGGVWVPMDHSAGVGQVAMTESEMKATWCPHARVTHAGGGTAANRTIGPQGGMVVLAEALCLGSMCSQWIWASSDHGADKQGDCGLKRAAP